MREGNAEAFEELRLKLRIERLARHPLELVIARQSSLDAEFDHIPVEKLLNRLPAVILFVVIGAQRLLQFLPCDGR